MIRYEVYADYSCTGLWVQTDPSSKTCYPCRLPDEVSHITRDRFNEWIYLFQKDKIYYDDLYHPGRISLSMFNELGGQLVLALKRELNMDNIIYIPTEYFELWYIAKN